MSPNRRMVAHAAIAMAASTIAIFACSDDRPPGASDPPGSSSGTSGTSSGTSTGGVDASSDGEANDGDVSSSSSSSSSSGELDAAPDGPVFECVGDTSITRAGGALPTTCADIPSCNPRCEQLAKNFKLGTAQTGVDCLRKLDSCANGGDVAICIAGAVDATCSDSTATTFCTPLVPACDPNAEQLGSIINQRDCENLVKGLNAEGRATFKACVDQKISAGTCAQEVGQCIGALQ